MTARPFVSFAECKEKVSIPDVLKVFGIEDRFRRQGRGLTGVCPLPAHIHGPSPNPDQFKISEDASGTSCFYCHGDCKRGGDVIEFVKAMTGYSAAHVRFWFAQHFPERLSLKKAKEKGSARPAKAPPKEEAREVLVTPPRAKANKSQQSNLSEEQASIKPLRFKLNVDPDVPYLKERGLRLEVIAKYGLGLCRRGMLKDYIAIPVYGYPREADENPVAYLGRWPGDDYDDEAGRPRYKWPKEFPKQRFLFGLNEALDQTDGQPILVVEGVFGALCCVQNGYQATVAVFGSSISDDQTDILIDTGRPIVLMFDGDEAGQAGMRKAAGKLIANAFVRVIKLADGRQPDDLSADELGQLVSFVNDGVR